MPRELGTRCYNYHFILTWDSCVLAWQAKGVKVVLHLLAEHVLDESFDFVDRHAGWSKAFTVLCEISIPDDRWAEAKVFYGVCNTCVR